MAKVIHPLFSGDVRGNFGKKMIFRRGGIVTRYFVPKDARSISQLSARQAFTEMVMSFLTQAQADLLYAAISHLHDDRYSLLAHAHDHGGLTGLADDDHTQYLNNTRGDARYPLIAHNHDHGALTGLADDDHTQYLNNTRGDARYIQLQKSQIAGATSGLTLTTSYQDIPGLSLTLGAGKWVLIGFLDARPGVVDIIVYGQLLVGSAAESKLVLCRTTSGTFLSTAGQQWLITLTGSTVVKFQSKCSATSTPSSTAGVNSTLLVMPG